MSDFRYKKNCTCGHMRVNLPIIARGNKLTVQLLSIVATKCGVLITAVPGSVNANSTTFTVG